MAYDIAIQESPQNTYNNGVVQKKEYLFDWLGLQFLGKELNLEVFFCMHFFAFCTEKT